MISPDHFPKRHGVNEVVSRDGPRAAPWQSLATRIREALAQRSFYVASSRDLGALWKGERIDVFERRRRITVFAAQYRWKVDTRLDGRAARFHSGSPAVAHPGEVLHRNYE